VVANALDVEWRRLGCPEPFTVVDAGAGPGTLARAVLSASPACGEAMEYVAVESSAAQRASHPDGVRSIAEMPNAVVGVVLANELLDNLAFTPVRHLDGAWEQAVVELHGDSLRVGWVEQTEPPPIDPTAVHAVWQPAATDWLATALGRIEQGRVIVIDYCRSDSADVEVRTYAQHGPAGDPLEHLGLKDITVDVDLAQLEQVRPASSIQSQADWLVAHGIEDLVAEGRRVWAESAAVGDLAALRMRSRVREAEALVEPTGLGGFTVAEWEIS
jgi:SAM-dependent MidA family methyltransferase